jgi:aminopeptidase N
LHIPLKAGLIDGKGKDLALKLEGGTKVKDGVLHLRKKSESFTFTGIAERPTVSLLREFSAPVNLTSNLTDRDLEFLIANDTDQFNRWQSAQNLAMKTLKEMTTAIRAGDKPKSPQRLAKAHGLLVSDEILEPAFRALILTMPSYRDNA